MVKVQVNFCENLTPIVILMLEHTVLWTLNSEHLTIMMLDCIHLETSICIKLQVFKIVVLVRKKAEMC